jgi:hypothetical protein
MSQELQTEYPIWRIVLEGEKLSEVSEWDWPTIQMYNDFLNMKADMETAYRGVSIEEQERKRRNK